MLRAANPPHQPFVALRQRLVLIALQIAASRVDQLLQSLRLRRLHGVACAPARRFRQQPTVVRSCSPVVERGQVVGHRDAVQRYRPAQCLRRHRQRAQLAGMAQQQRIGGGGTAKQPGRQRIGFNGGQLAYALGQRATHGLDTPVVALAEGELCRRRQAAVGHRDGAPGRGRQRFDAGCRQQVRSDDELRVAWGNARGRMRTLDRRYAHVAEHRAALLGKAGHVQGGGELAVEVGGGADQLRQGDDAGAANASDQNVGALLHGRRRQPPRQALGIAVGMTPLRASAGQRHQRRTQAGEARQVLVAGALVDRALDAELRRQGLHRHAVGLLRAVAAALAQRVVDRHAHVRIRRLAALAPPSQLRGAGLVVDQHADPGRVAQLPLHGVQVFAPPHRIRRAPVPLRLGADHHNLADPFGANLLDDLGHRQVAIHGLAAGHCHGVVEQHLVGDVGAGRHGGANGQNAGVEVGAVAEVDEDVPFVGERRLTQPVDAFGAHVRHRVGVPVHPLRHVVAADSSTGAAAGRHPSGGVVRAASAVQRLARILCALSSCQRVCPCLQLVQVGLVRHASQGFGQRSGDGGDVQLPGNRQRRWAGAGTMHLAAHLRRLPEQQRA